MGAGRRKTLGGCVLALGGLALAGASILGFAHRPRAATRFAPGLDEVAFASVELGDTADEVLAALGEPLVISSGSGLEFWNYAQPVASPSHMVRRSVRVDPQTGREVSIDDAVHYDYVSHWFSGGLR